MKQNNFEKLLLDNKIIDYRNLYILVNKKNSFLPSLSILVMGLYKEKLVFFKVSTSYHLIKFIEEININEIDDINILNKRLDTIVSLTINKKIKSYYVVEHGKNLYSIKKLLKK